MEESQRECVCTMRPSPEEGQALLEKMTDDPEVAVLCKKLEDVLNGNIPRTVLLCMAAVLGASFQGMPNDKKIAGTLSHLTFENMMAAHLNPKEIMWSCADVIMKTLVLMEYITRFKMLVGDGDDTGGETPPENVPGSDWKADDSSA